MRTALSVISAMLLTPAALLAQQDPAALAVLNKTIETINSAKTISYHTVVVGKGSIFAMLPETTGDVIAARPDDNAKAWKMGIKGKQVGVGDPLDVIAVQDPTKWAWVDAPARQVNERFTGSERGPIIDAANVLRIREIFEPSPLSKEVKCEVIKMEAPVDLDGVKCDVVYVDQGKDQAKGRWFIAQTDHLPRKYEWIMMLQKDVEDKRVCTLTQVKLNAEPPAGSFAISTPEGYTFSPAAAPTPPTPVAVPGDNPNVVPGTSAPGVPMKKERAVGVNVGDLAPDFELMNSAGEKVRLATLRGNVVVVDFWGTWSLASKKTTAVVQALANQFKTEKVKVFGVAVREGSEAAPTKFFADSKLTYTLLLKGDEPAKAYHVKKYPTLFVIGREGEIVRTFAGYDDKAAKDIGDAITGALKSAPAAADDPTGAAPRSKGQPDAKPDGKSDGDVDK